MKFLILLMKIWFSLMLFKSFELYLAFRYLRSKKTEGFISLSTWFSFVGIALGVAI